MLTSSFTGVRVASKTTQKAQKINTTVEARRTKASAPAKKSAFKVRTHRRRDCATRHLHRLDRILAVWMRARFVKRVWKTVSTR